MKQSFDWKAKISNIYLARRPAMMPARPVFRCGAPEELVSRLEKSVECRLPESLRLLLLQTDGVTDEIELKDSSWIEANVVIYSVDRMIEANRLLRREYPDRDAAQYVFFSTAGVDGIQFGVAATAVRQHDGEVFAWYPDETPVRSVAGGLSAFLESWCTGRAAV